MNWTEYLRALHFQIHEQVRKLLCCSKQDLSTVAAQGFGDVSYTIDVQPEQIVDAFFSSNPPEGGAVVLCEGLGMRTYPTGIRQDEAKYRILIDPLDGTREIMYDKRSCWVLTGVALNKGEDTTLGDIFTCLQTEVPPLMQDRSLILTAERMKGAFASVWNIPEKRCIEQPYRMQTSTAIDLRHGFAVFVNFFPGLKEQISRIEEAVLLSHLGPTEENKALAFTDQYISTAGQIYLLASGKYRLVADFRGKLGELMSVQGKKLSLCCHPYDLSTYLVLTESGGILTDAEGKPLNDPFDLNTNCSWFGYANQTLRDVLAPLLDHEMKGLTAQVALQTIARNAGMYKNDAVMDTGEARYRTAFMDGSGMVCCIATDQGYWQNAHYHEHTIEIIAVQKGWAACLIRENGSENLRLYSSGSYFTLDKHRHHNIYMFPNSITFTIKLCSYDKPDWHFSQELDTRSKELDDQYMQSLLNSK